MVFFSSLVELALYSFCQASLHLLYNKFIVSNAENECATLHDAVRKGNIKRIKALLNNGADVDGRDECGRTPLHLYRPKNFDDQELEILKILMDNGASLSLLDDEGDSALEYLFVHGNKETLRTLLQYNLDLFAKDAWDRTPLHYLVDNCNYRVLELLEGMEFDVNARDSDGQTALFSAVSYADVNSVEFLLKHGADVSIMNYDEETPLNCAVWSELEVAVMPDRQEMKVVELLLQYGADAQSLDFDETEDVKLDFHLPLLQIVIAHLAMIDSQGQILIEFARAQINSKTIYQDYFVKCQHQLEKLKKVVVYESVTLYKLLTENSNRIVHYASNHEFASKYKATVRRLRVEVDTYYYHVLRRRVDTAIQLAEMKLRAAAAVQELTGFHVYGHRIIVTRIVDYLDDQDLKDLTVYI